MTSFEGFKHQLRTPTGLLVTAPRKLPNAKFRFRIEISRKGAKSQRAKAIKAQILTNVLNSFEVVANYGLSCACAKMAGAFVKEVTGDR